MAVVANEEEMEFRHFRLSGTRDYALPPDRCVTVEADGVTLAVDLARSDLLLETELPRFAELIGTADHEWPTPLSLDAEVAGNGAGGRDAARNAGSLVPAAGGTTVAGRGALLMAGDQTPPSRFEKHLVLHVPNEETADGLMQWPETRDLIADRLGPTALVVTEENAEELRRRLKAVGLGLTE